MTSQIAPCDATAAAADLSRPQPVGQQDIKRRKLTRSGTLPGPPFPGTGAPLDGAADVVFAEAAGAKAGTATTMAELISAKSRSYTKNMVSRAVVWGERQRQNGTRAFYDKAHAVHTADPHRRATPALSRRARAPLV